MIHIRLDFDQHQDLFAGSLWNMQLRRASNGLHAMSHSTYVLNLLVLADGQCAIPAHQQCHPVPEPRGLQPRLLTDSRGVHGVPALKQQHCAIPACVMQTMSSLQYNLADFWIYADQHAFAAPWLQRQSSLFKIASTERFKTHPDPQSSSRMRAGRICKLNCRCYDKSSDEFLLIYLCECIMQRPH